MESPFAYTAEGYPAERCADARPPVRLDDAHPSVHGTGARSPVRRADERVKVVLLFAYTVALFAVARWAGLAAGAVALGAVVVVGRLPLGRMLGSLKPLYAILAFTLVFGSLTGGARGAAWSGAFGLEGGMLASVPNVPLAGGMLLSPAGFEAALFNVVRIVLLVVASMAVAVSTSAEELMGALRSLLGPLRRLRVPVDDAATALSLALQFVPVLGEELTRVRNAQASRGARFDAGGLTARLRAWGHVLVPLFVGAFRRADRVAVAMDARCYGASPARTSLDEREFGVRDAALLAVGLAVCAGCAALGRIAL